jgi:uncharacterized membrane protein YozB (DUF420 family)
MLVGAVFARRKMFVPHHKMVMTAIVLLNWVLIGVVMLTSYTQGVAPSVPAKLNERFFLTPSVHLALGAAAQILGTILVLRMWLEVSLPGWLKFEPIKFWMRLTLVLWLLTATLGVATYVTWYGVPFAARAASPTGGTGDSNATPEATMEATREAADPNATPAATKEASDPAGTPEATKEATAPSTTPEATQEATAAPVATPESTPEATKEVGGNGREDDDDKSGGNSGKGSDNSGKGSDSDNSGRGSDNSGKGSGN